MIEAVIFDLDGVLIDSEPVWEEVRREFVAVHGGRWRDDTQRKLMGMSTPEWARYLVSLGVSMSPDEVAQTVINEMAERYQRSLPLLPGAVEAVRRVGRRWRLGLASSSPPTLITVVLNRMDATEYFAAIVSTEEVARGKPASDVYLEAANRLQVEPAECAAVEDSSNGLRSAEAAGMRVIAIPRPDYPPDPDALDGAQLRLDSLTELTDEVIEPLA